MKTLQIFCLVFGFSIVAGLTFMLDEWLGLVAYTQHYLIFCIVVALAFSCAVRCMAKMKQAIPVGVAVFVFLAVNLLLPAPSERILRSVLLRIPAGTESKEIERIVKQQYQGSDFVLPKISIDETRAFVSLMSQRARNCSAISLKIKNGVVVDGQFVAD